MFDLTNVNKSKKYHNLKKKLQILNLMLVIIIIIHQCQEKLINKYCKTSTNILKLSMMHLLRLPNESGQKRKRKNI